MTNWRSSPVVAGLVIALFVLVQLAIPISRLGDDSTRRFSWQMYSVARPSSQFVVTTATGEIEIELDAYMARVRGDIDIIRFLPGHLCSAVPGAELVQWEGGVLEC